MLISMTFLVSTTFCKLLRKFHRGKFEKQMEIALKFNGHLGHICGTITHYLAGEYC